MDDYILQWLGQDQYFNLGFISREDNSVSEQLTVLTTRATDTMEWRFNYARAEIEFFNSCKNNNNVVEEDCSQLEKKYN